MPDPKVEHHLRSVAAGACVVLGSTRFWLTSAGGRLGGLRRLLALVEFLACASGLLGLLG